MNGLLWIEKNSALLNISNEILISSIELSESIIDFEHIKKKYNLDNLLVAYGGYSTIDISSKKHKDIKIDSDINILTKMLINNNQSLLAILSTGSSISINDKQIKRFGGYGYLLDDQGSIYLLGKMLIKKYIYFKELFISNTYTKYIESVLNITDLDESKLIYKIYNEQPFFMINFAYMFKNSQDEIYLQVVSEFCEEMLDYIIKIASANQIKKIRVIGRLTKFSAVSDFLSEIHNVEIVNKNELIYENYYQK